MMARRSEKVLVTSYGYKHLLGYLNYETENLPAKPRVLASCKGKHLRSHQPAILFATVNNIGEKGHRTKAHNHSTHDRRTTTCCCNRDCSYIVQTRHDSRGSVQTASRLRHSDIAHKAAQQYDDKKRKHNWKYEVQLLDKYAGYGKRS